MKKMKMLMTAFATFLLVGVVGVNAEEPSNEFKTLTSDGTLTVPFMNENEKSGIVGEYVFTFNTDDYSFWVNYCNDDATVCSISMGHNDGRETETYDIAITYEEVYTDEFKQIAPNGKMTVETQLLSNYEFWLSSYINSLSNENYIFVLNDCYPDYSVCRIDGNSADGSIHERHEVEMEYKEVYSDEFKNIMTNNKVVVSFKNFNDKSSIISEYLSTLGNDDYSFNVNSCSEDYSKCQIERHCSMSGLCESHEVEMEYKEVYSNEFKTILTDGKYVVKESNLAEEKIWIVRQSISKYNTENYWFNIDSCNEDYSTCRITTTYQTTGQQEQHDVAVTYKEEYSDTFKKFSKDGNLVITSSTVGDKNNLVWEYTNALWNDKYSFSPGTCNDDVTKCEITLYNNEPYYTETHVVNISYKEKYSEEFNGIAPDGKIVIPSIPPKNGEEAEFFLQNYLNTISTDARQYWPGTCNEDYSICDITLYIVENDNVTTETHKVKLSYSKLDENKANQVNKILATVPKHKTFVVEDLELINYIVNSGYTGDSMFIYESAESSYINYSSELKELLGNSNITASLDIRGGGYAIFAPSAIGGYVLSYDGVAYGLFHGGAMKKHVIYIPDETEESTDAYVKAAQERIDNYLGKNKIKVQYTGKLSELEDSDHEELGLGDKLKDEYYTIIYKDWAFDFVIVKDSSKMKDINKQVTNDVMTNVSISMNSPTLPLDTTIKVKELEKENKQYQEITSKLNENSYDVSNALIYDLKLYSTSNKEYITKLKDGNFEVKIPLSKELEGKDLIVYYVNDDGKVDEHAVTPTSDGYAVFTTNHFSIYTLAERKIVSGSDSNIETPNTLDSIETSFLMCILSLVGLSGLYIYTIKNKKRRA